MYGSNLIKQHSETDIFYFKITFIFYILYIHILGWETAIPGNQQCASCIGTLSFPVV